MTRRYGVLGDVHANLEALKVSLRALDRAGVERVLVTGDLVGYGPEPNECIALLAERDPICVVGNHDLIALGELSDERCIPLAQASLRWTARVLSRDARAYLGSLPRTAESPEGAVVVAHGSLDDPQQYVTTPGQASEQLRRLAFAFPTARCLLLGHTHRPAAYGPHGATIPRLDRTAVPSAWPVLLNAGAVGQSRELRTRARALVLDLDTGVAEFLALRYDVRACRKSLSDRGLSRRGPHLYPTPLGAARRLTRAARRLRGPSRSEPVV